MGVTRRAESSPVELELELVVAVGVYQLMGPSRAQGIVRRTEKWMGSG